MDLVDELDDSNVYEYVKRLTDAHRLQLFDVVMQYRAIFSDDAVEQPPQLPKPGAAGAGSRDPDDSDGGALYCWAQHRL
jgi:hypothetical protein